MSAILLGTPQLTEATDLGAQFATMLRAFAHHGGMLGGEDVVRRMRGLVEQPISVVAKWIVSREIVAIEWQLTMLVPMFQFDAESMQPSPGCRKIVSELSGVMDDWSIALWFATCNPSLGGVPPVDALSRDRYKALHAARATRCLNGG